MGDSIPFGRAIACQCHLRGALAGQGMFFFSTFQPSIFDTPQASPSNIPAASLDSTMGAGPRISLFRTDCHGPTTEFTYFQAFNFLAEEATVPSDEGYTIGPDDVLGVLFWREKELSVGQVTVRPDGMITLPLVNDIKAAGLTPEQLRDEVMKAANRFVEDPNATIVVRQINSRRLYVTGQVGKPGTYPLLSNTTILQALALAGGLAEYAKGNDIVLMRTENGKTKTFPFRNKDVINGKNLEQNIELSVRFPGDVGRGCLDFRFDPQPSAGETF